jgi:hypothetical protein
MTCVSSVRYPISEILSFGLRITYKTHFGKSKEKALLAIAFYVISKNFAPSETNQKNFKGFANAIYRRIFYNFLLRDIIIKQNHFSLFP